VGVGSGGDDDDGNVAEPPEVAAEVEAAHPREHDVDEHHVGGCATECGERLFAVRRFLDLPALVFESEADGGADPLVVFNGQDPDGHATNCCRRRRRG
jgi:hypothetical protein